MGVEHAEGTTVPGSEGPCDADRLGDPRAFSRRSRAPILLNTSVDHRCWVATGCDEGGCRDEAWAGLVRRPRVVVGTRSLTGPVELSRNHGHYAESSSMRRTAAVLALVMLASPQARASRADPVPAPTVNVAITVQGVLVTKQPIKAAWSYDERGRIGQLDLDAVNPPGAVLTVNALWTSKDFLALRQFPQLVLEATAGHTGTPTSSMPASVSYGYRFRDAGRAWGAWQDTFVSREAGNPLSGFDLTQLGVYAPDIPKSGKQVQVQWRLRVDVADPGREAHRWLLRTNQP